MKVRPFMEGDYDAIRLVSCNAMGTTRLFDNRERARDTGGLSLLLNNELVGYATWDDVGLELTDLAILPQLARWLAPVFISDVLLHTLNRGRWTAVLHRDIILPMFEQVTRSLGLYVEHVEEIYKPAENVVFQRVCWAYRSK